MDKNILLTISIPTFNRSKELKLQLDNIHSILLDTIDSMNVEILVSDNCSNDSTSDVVESFLKLSTKYKFTYVRNSSNLGSNMNFIMAITKASGRFVWAMSDDDLIEKDSIQYLLTILSKNKEIGFGFINFYFNESRSRTCIESNDTTLSTKDINLLIPSLLGTGMLSSCIFRRSLLSKEAMISYINTVPGYAHMFYGVDNINMMISNTTIFFAVGILMILVGIASIITKKDIGANLLVLVSMLIILIFILTRGVGIISMEVSEFIFSSILFWPFKHPDKFQIFIPFVVTAICASAFNKISASKVKLLFGLIIFQTVAVGYPFFTGNIESKYSLARHNLSWEESNISFHVEVPEDYKNVGEIIKENGGCKGKILGLPYSSITSASWVNYPKWKFFGSDLTAQFFPCPLININNTSLGENYYKSVIEKDITSTDFINQFMIDIRRRSIEYLIYHYDAHRDMIKKQIYLIKMLRKIGLIHKIDDNTHFALYKIDEDLFMPRFNLQNTNFNIGEKEIPLSKIVSIKSFFGYKIKVEGIDNNYYLNFTDTYHPMFLLLPEENILDSIKRVISGMGMIPHSETIYGGSLSNKKNSFGNSWFIDTNNICDDNELACKYSKNIYTMTFNLIFIPSIAIAILFAISIIYLLLLILFSVKNSKQRKLTIQD